MTPERVAHLARMNEIRLAKYIGLPVYVADEAFWAKTEPEPNSGCLLWIGARHRQGYGLVWSRRGTQKARFAHRIAYEDRYGAIPPELEIDHLCRVRCCVNPRHLEAVPLIVNNHRGMGVAAINMRKTHCPRGHLHEKASPGRPRICKVCRRAAHMENRDRDNARMRAYQARLREARANGLGSIL